MIERGAFLNAGGNFAFVVTDNIAKRVTIQLGGRNYTHVEIKTGVNENDIIVVSRIDDFFDYDKFIIN
jgi:HlyD family secretion protein